MLIGIILFRPIDEVTQLPSCHRRVEDQISKTISRSLSHTHAHSLSKYIYNSMPDNTENWLIFSIV